MIFDADDENSVKNEGLKVKCASSGNLHSYSATLPRKDPTATVTKLLQDSIQTFPVIPHKDWHSSSKRQFQKKVVD